MTWSLFIFGMGAVWVVLSLPHMLKLAYIAVRPRSTIHQRKMGGWIVIAVLWWLVLSAARVGLLLLLVHMQFFGRDFGIDDVVWHVVAIPVLLEYFLIILYINNLAGHVLDSAEPVTPLSPLDEKTVAPYSDYAAGEMKLFLIKLVMWTSASMTAGVLASHFLDRFGLHPFAVAASVIGLPIGFGLGQVIGGFLETRLVPYPVDPYLRVEPVKLEPSFGTEQSLLDREEAVRRYREE